MTAHVDGVSGLAGSFRGIWFSTSNTSARIEFNAGFVLRHTFAIYSWIWHQQPGHDSTLISKDRGIALDYSFKVYINTSSQLAALVTKDTDASSSVTATVTNASLTD